MYSTRNKIKAHGVAKIILDDENNPLHVKIIELESRITRLEKIVLDNLEVISLGSTDSMSTSADYM